MDNIGFKELYEVSLKLTYPIEVNGRKMESGEVIAFFDRIQIANFEENKRFINASGGFGNHSQIWWEETKEIRVSLSQGVFSRNQLALMTNAKLIQSDGQSELFISRLETIETDEKGVAFVKFPISEPIFVYNEATGEKMSGWTYNGNKLMTSNAYTNLLVSYQYNYENGYELLSFGNALTNGYLSLEGKTRVKDDITGQVKTGIIKIPKLKLLSNLSMRLGNDGIPLVGRLDAVAVPTGNRGSKKVMELLFLNDDIDSDM
jgi:hypothetical protein